LVDKKRIAICISGQIRTDDSQLSAISLAADEIGADVFISVWRKRGSKQFGSGHATLNLFRLLGSDLSAYIPKIWCDNFEAVFPDWQKLLPTRKPITKKPLQSVFPKAVIDIEDDILDMDIPTEKNSLRMLYKIWRCNSMKRKHEKSNGFRYHRVIRTRPDILLDFGALVAAPCQENEILIKARRGNALHDTYWAADSVTDDKMANMFGHLLANGVDGWKGIHHELAHYVHENKIMPTNIRCVKTDFHEFGAYSMAEQNDIVAKFRAQLLGMRNSAGNDVNDPFTNIMTGLLMTVCDSIAEGNPKLPDDKILQDLIVSLTASTPPEKLWNVLPTASLAIANHPEVDAKTRGYLAYNTLIKDALVWNQFLTLRAESLIEILPNSGLELLPFLLEVKPGETLKQIAADGLALHGVWQTRLGHFDQQTMTEARDKVLMVILNSNSVRGVIAEELKKAGQLDALVQFAKLYGNAFPERNNARNFVAQSQRLLDHEKANKP